MSSSSMPLTSGGLFQNVSGDINKISSSFSKLTSSISKNIGSVSKNFSGISSTLNNLDLKGFKSHVSSFNKAHHLGSGSLGENGATGKETFDSLKVANEIRSNISKVVGNFSNSIIGAGNLMGDLSRVIGPKLDLPLAKIFETIREVANTPEFSSILTNVGENITQFAKSISNIDFSNFSQQLNWEGFFNNIVDKAFDILINRMSAGFSKLLNNMGVQLTLIIASIGLLFPAFRIIFIFIEGLARLYSFLSSLNLGDFFKKILPANTSFATTSWESLKHLFDEKNNPSLNTPQVINNTPLLPFYDDRKKQVASSVTNSNMNIGVINFNVKGNQNFLDLMSDVKRERGYA